MPGRRRRRPTRDGIRLTRRALGGLAAGALARPALAQAPPLRAGLMLPYSGTFAQLGENITSAFERHLAGCGGKLGGRAVTVVKLDDASLVVDRTVAAVLSLVDRATVLVKGLVVYDGDPAALAGSREMLGRLLGV